MLPLYTQLLFQNFQEFGLHSEPSKWSKFKCLLRLVVILLVSPWERWENIRESQWCDLQTVCWHLAIPQRSGPNPALLYYHLIKWSCTYLIRTHGSHIKCRPVFRATSVSDYCRHVCSNFWSICGNVEWDIVFPQAKTKGFVRREAVSRFIPG